MGSLKGFGLAELEYGSFGHGSAETIVKLNGKEISRGAQNETMKKVQGCRKIGVPGINMCPPIFRR